MRPIDADALSRKIQDEYRGSYSEVQISPYKIDRMIDAQPTVDTTQAVHAHWIRKFLVQTGGYECSNCRRYSTLDTNYCGSCGAKMDEVYGREKLNQIHNLIFNQKLN